MDAVGTRDTKRTDSHLADQIRAALSIQREEGCVVAWIYLSKLDVPDATILRVLADSVDARQFSTKGAHGAN